MTRPVLKRPLAWFAAAYVVLVVLALPSMILAEEPVAPAAAEHAAGPGGPPSGDLVAGDSEAAASGDPAPATAGAGAPASPAPTSMAPSAATEPTAVESTSAPGGSAEEAPPTDDGPVAFAASPGSVTIKDFSFNPGSVTVSVGETVTWQNSGPSGHSATARDGSFDTGVLEEGRSASHRFTKAGSFAYICTPHPFMHGTVEVAASSGGGSESTSGGSESTSSGSGGTASSSSASGGAASSSAEATGGETLATTGSDVWILAWLGLAMLGLGIAVERRTSQ